MQKKEGKYQTNDLTLLHRTKEKNTIHRKKFPKKATSVKVLHILWNSRFLWIRAAIVVGPNSFALSVLTIVIESGKNAAKSVEVFNVCQHTRFFAASTVAASLIISCYPHYHFIGWFCLYIPLTQCPCAWTVQLQKIFSKDRSQNPVNQKVPICCQRMFYLLVMSFLVGSHMFL